MNVEGISGGASATVPRADGAQAGNGVGCSQVVEPVGDVRAPRVDAGQLPSPLASPSVMELGAHAGRASSPPALSSVMGAGSGAEQEPQAPEPLMEMGLGMSCHHQEEAMGRVAGPVGEAAKEVENIPREPPHPWDAHACVLHTWLKRGDRVDIVEEEDVDPQIETLKNHLSVVNIELQVS